MNIYFNTFDQEKESFLKEYFQLLRFGGLSADLKTMPELLACVQFLEKKLTGMGAQVERWNYEGLPPVLFAEFKSDVKNAPTLLFYSHYDVQPVDPENLWDSPPFEPTLRDGKIYARGANDNKGQLSYSLLAVQTFLKKEKSLSFNLKWIIEGEEEHGSTALHNLLPQKAEAIKADGIVVIDVGMPSLSRPALSLGVRGIISMDLKVTGPKGDLHSGESGGAILNPLHFLVDMLAKARDEEGKVTIPGFYDQVKEVSVDDKKLFAFETDEKEFIDVKGVPPTGGERNRYSFGERTTVRPTLEINGINGGYSGDGFKTVIPSIAEAKISCRLVPDQNPFEIGHLVKKYFESESNPSAKVEVHLHTGGKAVRCSPQSFLIKAANTAVEETFGKKADYILCGGSIPIAADLATYSGGDLLFVGMGLVTDNVHAPNENFSLEQLRSGASLIGHLLENFVKEFNQ